MKFQIVGRQQDLASIHAFIDEANGGGSGALVLEGEAGIGKSTLWLAGVDHAREHGLRVLRSRPAEAEHGLAHAGLGDLLDGVLDEILSELSPPRRRALAIALLLEETPTGEVNPRALGIAVRSALQLLAEVRPVLIAIDDVQWLDSSSDSALAFALRRLDASSVQLLLARRLVDGVGPSAIEQALASEGVRRLPVGPLSVGALHAFLRDRLDRLFARQTLLRIHEYSGGNPFFALELARALDGEIDPTRPLPVPETLDELVRARLAGLPRAARDALALTAALGSPSEALVARAGVDAATLEAALRAHVIERENGTLRFTHPLLSSVLYADLGNERRDVHRRAAELVNDPLVRARHLALAAEPPDGEVAAVLDESAQLAIERGAAAAAAELAEHALRLTASDAGDERHRRALAAARAHRAAGEWTRAKAIANALAVEDEAGPLRAEALVLLSDFEGLHLATALLENALRDAIARPALQAVIHCKLAWATRFKDGFVPALDHARSALALADALDDDELRADALLMLAFLGGAVGDPDATAYGTRAREIAVSAKLDPARYVHVDAYEVTDLEAARALLEDEYNEFRERDELATANSLYNLCWIELWTGRWQLASEYAERAYEITVQYELEAPWHHVPLAAIAAHRGQLELARAHAERGLRLGEEQMGLHTPVHLGTMGVVSFQSGDLQEAAAWFAEAETVTTRLGWRGPGHRWWTDDHVEALVALDRVGDAARILDAWEADARRLDNARVLAQVTRCRGLIAAARGDVATAVSLLEDAVTRHEAAGDTFGHARALLALGVVRRRERQKRTAREAISAALGEFEALGAAAWIARAHTELGRIGGRTREEGLTAAERRVAALVAEGRTNKEVAAALFLGERTVETHLSHVYAKLGLRSRAELARSFRQDEQSSGGVTISN